MSLEAKDESNDNKNNDMAKFTDAPIRPPP